MIVRVRWLVVGLIGLLLVVALFAGDAEGFGLRKHGPDDGLAVVKRRLAPSRAKGDSVSAGPARKPWSVREEQEDEEDDDEEEEDDDEEEDEELAAIRKATQERLLRARRGIASRDTRKQPAAKQTVAADRNAVDNDDDDDDDNDDDDEEEDDETEPRSIFNLFGLLGRTSRPVESEPTPANAPNDDDDNDDDDENDDSEAVVRAGRKQWKTKPQPRSAAERAREESSVAGGAVSWLDELKRVYETVVGSPDARNEEKETHTTTTTTAATAKASIVSWLQSLTTAGELENGDEREKENPIINLLAGWLQSNADNGDSNEEIRLRPVGAYADDGEDDDRATKRKPKGDSKLVQLLNDSPLNALFSAEELPQEQRVSSAPKKRPKHAALDGPSKVVKQRIAISPEDFEQLLLRVPSFVPDYSQVRGEECRRQGQIFERQLRGKRLWALQMVDASARLASGLLRGNANQLGDYDLCTGIATRVRVREDELVRLRGKYCLAHVDVVAEDAELRLPVHLLQGGGFVKSTLNDPDHFLPRFTTINWGICLPAACSFEDAGSIVQHFVRPYNSTGIKLFLELEEGNCHVRQVRTWSRLLKDHWQLVAVLGFYTFVAVVTLVATLNDYEIFIKIEPPSTRDSPHAPPDRRTTNIFHQTLMAFSLKKTLPQLVGAGDGDEAQRHLRCLYGLKAVASGALFLALRLVPLGFQPFTNRNEFTESFNAPWSVAVRLVMLYADVFLVVSGFLAAYHMVREYRERARVPWFKRIAGRYLRLAFPLVPVLVFYAWVWEHLGSGPQWGDVVTKNANLCKHGYLSNLLFMHNWYPIEEACAPHTFQLAIEMQLSILAPFLMVILVRSPFYGTAAYVLLSALSTAIRFAATTEDRLTPYVFHGVRLTQLYRTLNLSFAETLHRLTPYLAGFGLGYLMQETGRPRQERGVRFAGWLGAAIALLWCVCRPLDIVRKDFRYEAGEAAQFAALAPLSWSLGLCWVIYYCATETESALNRVLSSRPMVFLGRLTYSLTLVQFLVFFYFAGTTRGSEVFSFTTYVNRTEVCLALVAALTLTLLFDLPIQNVKRLFDQSGVFEQLETPATATTEATAVSSAPEEQVPDEPAKEEPPAEAETAPVEEQPDFVSPFDDERDEDDGIWLRKRQSPADETPSKVEDFWAQRDDDVSDDVKPDVPSVEREEEASIPQAQEEEEEEEAEEEAEEEEEEEEEEDIDEDKEVKRRPAANGAAWSRF